MSASSRSPALDKLLAFLKAQRSDIIEDATHWVCNSAIDLQGQQPRSETHELCTMVVDGYVSCLESSNTNELYGVADSVVDYKGALLFRISTLQRLFLGFVKAVLPRTPELFPSSSERFEVTAWLNTTYQDVLFHLSDAYQLRVTNELSEHVSAAHIASKSKSVFLASMNHELRTPLSAVMGALSLLKRREKDRPTELLDTAIQSSEQLLGLIENIMEMARLDVTESEPMDERFDPSRVGLEVVALQISAAERRGLTLTFNELPEPIELIGDPVRLRTLVVHLVNNALKFTEEGGVTVSLTHRYDTGHRFVLCGEVKDTGIGLSIEAQGHVFSPFEQVSPGSTRKYNGAGLGLAICHKIVSQLGGEIGVDSVVGQGATFWFEIPFQEASSVVTGEHGLRRHTDQLNVLVIENEAINRDLLANMIDALGHNVTVADSAKAGIDAALEQQFELILTDIHMPQMDGYEVLRLIRENESQWAPFIVAITADVAQGTRERCLAAGANDYLAKPFTLTELEVAFLGWMARLGAS